MNKQIKVVKYHSIELSIEGIVFYCTRLKHVKRITFKV